jgi:hypothetical protein
LDFQRRLRETRVEALVRSVGRSNGKARWFRGVRRRPRDNFAVDFRDQGDDLWRVLRS